jgi:hypothetical protein
VSTGASRRPGRRRFLAAGAASIVTLAVVDRLSLTAHAASVCSAGTCSTTTVWMLAADWGYPKGPHGKTRLVSRASRLGAANRVARTEQEALDMNLHKCSFAPAIEVEVCEARADAAFATWATDWNNPWNRATVSVLDLRRLPADQDLFACPASSPTADPTSPSSGENGLTPASLGAQSPAGAATSGGLAFTGGTDRRLLFVGAGAIVAGTLLRALGGKTPTPAHEIDAVPED